MVSAGPEGAPAPMTMWPKSSAATDVAQASRIDRLLQSRDQMSPRPFTVMAARAAWRVRTLSSGGRTGGVNPSDLGSRGRFMVLLQETPELGDGEPVAAGGGEGGHPGDPTDVGKRAVGEMTQ